MYTDTRFIHYLVIFTILTETLKLQLHNFYIQWQLQFYLLAEAHNAVNILIRNENQVSQYKSTCSELYCNVETCDTNFCTNFSVAPHLPLWSAQRVINIILIHLNSLNIRSPFETRVTVLFFKWWGSPFETRLRWDPSEIVSDHTPFETVTIWDRLRPLTIWDCYSTYKSLADTHVCICA